MSKAHAKKFIDQLHKDKALQKKVNEASKHIVDVAKSQGYKVTSGEISDALKEHWSQSKRKDDDHPCVPFSQPPGA